MTTSLQPLIQSRILSLRNQRVMLDADLAQLYGVETRAVVQAVKRNAGRFPADFMFQLDTDEWTALKSQTVISNEATITLISPFQETLKQNEFAPDNSPPRIYQPTSTTKLP